MLSHSSITNVIFINRSHSVTIYNDLELIDLQNIATSLSIYESPYDPVAERTLQRRQESFRNRYRSHNVKLGPSLANIRTLDIMRQQEAASNGGVAPYEMPIIECKTMTTMAMEKKLDDPEANYQLKKIDYEKKQRKRKEMLNGTFLPLKLEI
ncbi:hypothetical protein DID88_006425 [Monilinia fructigena]|uniref:Uncharacterized protein n=1 Tax=Monilinia fructigena TaxID=38457 RepID=A0A395IG47_9HELO|nr:hypothetical protein DID88_006425 [Monilinia fructigena]